jgi:hypothetical protein
MIIRRNNTLCNSKCQYNSSYKKLNGKYLERFTAFHLHLSIFLYFISHRIKFVFYFVHEMHRSWDAPFMRCTVHEMHRSWDAPFMRCTVHEMHRFITSIYLTFQFEFVLCNCKTLRKIRLLQYCDLYKFCRISCIGRLYEIWTADKWNFFIMTGTTENFFCRCGQE